MYLHAKLISLYASLYRKHFCSKVRGVCLTYILDAEATLSMQSAVFIALYNRWHAIYCVWYFLGNWLTIVLKSHAVSNMSYIHIHNPNLDYHKMHTVEISNTLFRFACLNLLRLLSEPHCLFMQPAQSLNNHELHCRTNETRWGP